jgi:hypothetical protein
VVYVKVELMKAAYEDWCIVHVGAK